MFIALTFSVLAGATTVSDRRERLLDTRGRPAVGHVMKIDPISDENGGGAYVTYRFWVEGDPQRYSHTGTFTGWETPARVSASMVSGAVVRRTVPVRYDPSDPWVNRVEDPDRTYGGRVVTALVAAGAGAGWLLFAATLAVRLRRRRHRNGADAV